MKYLIIFLFAILCAYGSWRISVSILHHDLYSGGKKSMQQIGRWYKPKPEFWEMGILDKLTSWLCRIVYLDDTASETLARQLRRAGMSITPEQFTARKYLIYFCAGTGVLLSIALQFWFGVILFALIAVYGVMRQREAITSRIKARDDAIALEMPRFIRTLCRTLLNSRDIYSALASYQKVAGPILAEELEILLAHMRTGGVSISLQQFQKRLGTDSAFRLCSTLQEIDRGIDQTATLDYLADDMARQSKINIQKTLSTRPGKMRMTYLPAVGVCVAMIMYVLVVFVMTQLNHLY